MAQVTKNAFKGYSFQSYVYLLFACLMDTNKEIQSINAEIDKNSNEINHNFDDINIESLDKSYFIQIKNYKNLQFSDIIVNESEIALGGSISQLKKGCSNVVVLYDCDITSNATLFSLPAYKKKEVYIISLTTEFVSEFIDNLYKDDKRIVDMCHFTGKRIYDEQFFLKSNELPVYKVFNQKLKEDTLQLREQFESMTKKTLFVIGKPGVGKSHFVNEICNARDKQLIYRFWIDSQDIEKNARLQYSNFLKDLCYRVFNKAGKYSEELLIAEIKKQELTIIIDGLDHVENYNCREIEQYFNFIEKLEDIRTVVLSRPLKHRVDYEIYNLSNWNYNQTIKYLGMCHDIKDISICRNIYHSCDGYPIITYFMANHFKIYGELVTTEKINEVNEYYDLLTVEANTLSALAIFLVSNTFITMEEILMLSSNEILSNIIFEFVNSYPYLFEIVLNRYSLIHDSFNRYLMTNKRINKQVIEPFTVAIMNSIANNELRFLNRINDLLISDSFRIEILKKYSDFNSFNNLLDEYWDIEAIKEFYFQLDYFLKTQEVVLDHYQYYSLILIQECCVRIDLFLNLELFFQQIQYLMENRKEDLPQIYSNGVAFNIIKVIMKVSVGGQFEKNDKISCRYVNSHCDKYFEIYKEERKLLSLIDGSELQYEKMFVEILASNNLFGDEDDIVVAYIIAYLYLHKVDYLGLWELFNAFLLSMHTEGLLLKVNDSIRELGIDYEVKTNVLKRARYMLHQVGKLSSSNPYLNITLEEAFHRDEAIDLNDSANYISNVIRLASWNNKLINVCRANRCYIAMAYEKDRSLITLPIALYIFELKNVISENESMKILSMVDSATSGLHFLKAEYANLKGPSQMDSLVSNGIFKEPYNVNLFSLDAELINRLPSKFVAKEVHQLMSCHSYSKIIEERDIINGLTSKHEVLIKGVLDKYGFKVLDLSTYSESIKRKPEEKGYIEIDDIDYLIECGMDYLTIAKYPNGYYDCFSILEVYRHFSKDELIKNSLSIIHESMKCENRVTGRRLSYSMYLGNIPSFFNEISIKIDWKTMLDIMMEFLHKSFFYEETI